MSQWKSYPLSFKKTKTFPTSYRFGKDREQFYVSLVKKQTSQLLIVTAVCNKREATRVNWEDAIS